MNERDNQENLVEFEEPVRTFGGEIFVHVFGATEEEVVAGMVNGIPYEVAKWVVDDGLLWRIEDFLNERDLEKIPVFRLHGFEVWPGQVGEYGMIEIPSYVHCRVEFIGYGSEDQCASSVPRAQLQSLVDELYREALAANAACEHGKEHGIEWAADRLESLLSEGA